MAKYLNLVSFGRHTSKTLQLQVLPSSYRHHVGVPLFRALACLALS